MRAIAIAGTTGGFGCLTSWPAPVDGERLTAHRPRGGAEKVRRHQADVGQVGPQHQPPAPRQVAIREQQDDQREHQELPGPQSGGYQDRGWAERQAPVVEVVVEYQAAVQRPTSVMAPAYTPRPMRIHPMGLPGWRRATTTPGTANARKPRRTCHPSPTSRGGQARGTSRRSSSASVSAPRMTAIAGDATRKQREAPSAAGARAAACGASPTRADTTPGSFRQRYRSAPNTPPGHRPPAEVRGQPRRHPAGS